MARHFVVDPTEEIPLKVGTAGPTAAAPETVMTVFKRTAEAYPKRTALCVKRNDEWQTWTFEQYYSDVLTAAKSLIKLGLEPAHAVAVLGFNSPEWFIADLAAIFAGGLAAGIYTTNEPEPCRYVADHARANVIFVENEKQLAKILQVRDRLPHCKAIVQYIGEVSASARAAGVLSWLEFMEVGADVADFELQRRMDAQRPGHCCTLIYTSGTTGNPKGVMISHDNITWTTRVTFQRLGITPEEEHHIISYLPLSHIAAQLVDIHGPVANGVTIWFAQPDALKGTLVNTLREARPTVFLGVPRVWEKIKEKMQAIGAQTTGIKRSIATWAKDVGLRGGYALMNGESVPWGWWLANKLVFDKVRANLGLDRCHLLATAAAPIGKDVLDYFLSLNMPLCEVYGMSECTGPQTISCLDAFRLGTVGKPVPGMELKLDNPDKDGNGEICYRGRHICMGYLFNEEKTREAIDEEGFLHSGDVGRLDDDGHLMITGRIKELLITAGGENVAPVPIEDAMKEEMPLLSNCMVIGDKRKFLSMMVTLKCEVDEEGGPTDNLTPAAIAILQGLGSNATTVSAAATDDKVKQYIEEGMARANERSVSRAQRIQKFHILLRDFSIPGGELGPTLKLKRSVVHGMYEGDINAMYA